MSVIYFIHNWIYDLVFDLVMRNFSREWNKL